MGCPDGARAECVETLPRLLAGGRCAQELTAARSCARPTAHLCGIFKRDLILGKARADGCTLAASSPFSGRSVTPPPGTRMLGMGPDDASAIIAGKPLLACGNTHYTLPRGKRTHQSAQHDGGVIAIRQRVEHSLGALCSTVAWVGTGSGERVARWLRSTRAASATSNPTSQCPVWKPRAMGIPSSARIRHAC